ncbi:DUF2163 domain-containing protein [Sphingomonas japonica]|uniref:Phage protein (TIGR02218 family) n=1 Tax=Sphingomonas japonica TaxID=511662 RepID=A0ABX0U2Z9_9SPHN|nr:DUF2163 domain-containing protein [Sphingomonas japonica]NIJ23737.1 putative phage protein (TIGR02218 family) [Sphingomonas japonica]
MHDITTRAFAWRVERRDGVAFGLTSHDRDLWLDGMVYRANPGMTPSAIERSDGLDADSMDVTGALDHPAIVEADLLAGRWDGARVALFAVDWTGTQPPIALGEGTIGAIETRAGGFTAELRGASARFDAAVVEETSPECRAELGDRRCRVAMAARRRFAVVMAAEGAVLTLDRSEPSANGYGGGLLRWVSGRNSGLEDAIAQSDGPDVTLRAPPCFAAEGARVELIEGCDKSLATCRGRFGNAANFRGEPFLPGIDLLTRYPGA